MGNTVPQRRCREAGTAAGPEGKKNSKNVAEVEAPIAPMRAAVTQRMQRDNEEREEEAVTTRAWRRRAGGGGGSTPAAGTVVTVEIVMSRKDAEALVARLHERSARERKARMAELKRELRAGGSGGGGGASPVSCRDAWTPRLSPVEENQ